MSRRSRAWESVHEEQADIGAADSHSFQNAGKIFTHSSVQDLSDSVGGNRQLATLLLQEQGKEVTKRSINSQMKSIQRWIAKEKGSSSQSSGVSKANRALLNRISTNQKVSGKKTQINIKGPSSVNGYKRDNRSVEIYLDPDQASELLEALGEGNSEAAWDILADAYGVSEFHAYEGATFDIN